MRGYCSLPYVLRQFQLFLHSLDDIDDDGKSKIMKDELNNQIEELLHFLVAKITSPMSNDVKDDVKQEFDAKTKAVDIKHEIVDADISLKLAMLPKQMCK